MSEQAAGGVLMWLAGLMLGLSVVGPDYSGVGLGALLTFAGIFYIKRFAERGGP